MALEVFLGTIIGYLFIPILYFGWRAITRQKLFKNNYKKPTTIEALMVAWCFLVLLIAFIAII
ncbi:MAG: hypothetical protein ABIF85_04660 [Nanoarchaeota archaeon]|nr:hypothetical protein [Nanoarchaeota archaeon]MBU4452452.1 hypothetical protein [Nanoarchaeota archaeon]